MAAAIKKLRALSIVRPQRRREVRPPSAPKRVRNPQSGLAMDPQLTIYHDASGGEFAAVIEEGCRVRLVIYQFDGSYLSIAAALTQAQRKLLGPGRLFDVKLEVETTRPLTVFLRLNIQAGEDGQTLYETIVVDSGERAVSFDLDGVRLAFHKIDSLWLDVIFSEPEMTEITVREVDLKVTDRGKD
ncbi:MAG: DUF6478 family protein [Pseudomonadota bacterium]